MRPYSLTFFALMAAAKPVAAEEQRVGGAFSEELTVFSEKVPSGHIEVQTADGKARIDYAFDQNGRGPHHVEEISFGDGGLPVEYTITGTSEFGGNVTESFARKGDGASWSSQADSGKVTDASKLLYLAKDDSPYSVVVYARALLAAPGGKLEALPDGELRITRLKRSTFSSGRRTERVTFYRIEGRNTAPDYVALDEKNRAFAVFADQILSVRTGWEAEAPALETTFAKINEKRLKELQKKLAHQSSRAIHIRNVRIFEPASASLSALSDVLVKNGRIISVTPTSQSSSRSLNSLEVDGEGGVLVPGLNDMHAHYMADFGLLYLAAGITTVRDMGNDNERLLKIVGKIKEGALPGPDIVYNGFIEGKSPYSASGGILVDSLGEALDAVRWYKKHGYWQIKIYSSFDRAWVKPVAALAHSLNMGVTGHIPAFATPDEMIDAGYDEITHSNQLMLGWLLKPGEDSRTALRATAMERAADLDLSSAPVSATINHMRSKDIPLDTTLSIREQLMLSRAGEDPPGFAPVIDHFPVGLRRKVRQTWVPINSPEQDERYKQAFRKIIDMISLLHASGIRLLPGTDDGEGFAYDRELELYVAAGIPPATVLSNATLGMAQYFGRQKDRGTIEPGKMADMFLIPGDPTKNISEIRRPRMVFKGKYYYFPDQIYSELIVKPFSTRPTILDK